MRASYVRYRVIAVTTLMAVLLYLDRFCISFAEIYIQEDLGLSNSQVGWMISAFFWTYAICQVPSGWLTDRFGARTMLTIYILLWSLFTGLTGAAGVFSALLALRLGFGIGQAGAYPTSANLVSKWVPFTGRGSASSIIAFGGRIGGALAPLLTALLIVQFVPLSTPSIPTAEDLLDVPRLCYEMQLGRDKKNKDDLAARTGVKLRAEFSDEARMSASVSAAAYQKAFDELIAKAKREGRKTDGIAPKTAVPEGVDVTEIVAGLKTSVQNRDLFHADDLRDLVLSPEGKMLRKLDRASLDQPQVERLNRLVLEAIYPESIKKIYCAGWRYVMFTYGAVGILVALAFWFVVRDRPADHRGCNEQERKQIEGDRPAQVAIADGKVGGVPIWHLLTSVSMWMNCLMQWCTNVGWVFLVTWLPRYLATVHEVPVVERGFMAFVPLVVGWFGMLLGGKLTDLMVRLVGLRWGRALPMTLSRFLAMAAYIACLFDPSPWVAVTCFSIVAFATDLGTGAMWAYMQDVGGRHVGSVLGWGNMWGNLGAAVTPPLLIWIVTSSNDWTLPWMLTAIVGDGENRNWNLAFLTCAGAFMISGLAALGVNASIPIVPKDASTDDE